MAFNIDAYCCAEALRKMRLDRHLTQEELEARCKMAHQQISRMESGKTLPKIENIRRIVWGMNASFAEFGMYFDEKLREILKNRGETDQMPQAAEVKIEYYLDK